MRRWFKVIADWLAGRVRRGTTLVLVLVAVGVGAALGHAVGDGVIVWGTAGEWVTRAVTAGALWFAVGAFLHERDENIRRHAEMVTVTVHPTDRETDDNIRVHVVVVNDGTTRVFEPVVTGAIEGLPEMSVRPEETSRADHLEPGGTRSFNLRYPDHLMRAEPLPPGENIAVTFRDVNHPWWRVYADGRAAAESIKRPPPVDPPET